MVVNRSPNQALCKAVNVIGSQSAMARLLNVTQAAVWRWVAKERPLPAEHVITVEDETVRLGSPVSRHDLRPDIYPREHEASITAEAETARC